MIVSGKNWKDGCIYKFEDFILRRHQTKPLFARAVATILVSSMLKKAILLDLMGKVDSNLFIMTIGESGSGKTPPIKRALEYMLAYDPDSLIAPRFTLEGLTEFLTEQATPKHGVIINDEASLMIAEKGKKQFLGVFEFLSKLWDGWAPGYLTRSFKKEGGFPVHFSFLAGSTTVFLKDYAEELWAQGIGNRYLWILLDRVKPEKDKPGFMLGTTFDKEWDEIMRSMCDLQKDLCQIDSVTVDFDAEEIWIDERYRLRLQAFNCVVKHEANYIEKMPLQTLKLAMCYAASRKSYVVVPKDSSLPSILNIKREDMQRAIDDTLEYLKCWREVYDLWTTLQEDKERARTDSRADSVKKLIRWSIQNTSGLITVRTTCKGLNGISQPTADKIIQAGWDMGWLEPAHNNVTSVSTLSLEEIAVVRKYSPTSCIPSTWRVTDDGRKAAMSV